MDVLRDVLGFPSVEAAYSSGHPTPCVAPRPVACLMCTELVTRGRVMRYGQLDEGL